MDSTQDTDTRLTELEIKASYAEDLLDQLNQTIYRQQQLLDVLSREMAVLRRQLPEAAASGERNPREDLPPHY